jgi:hypothetical protein
VIGLDCVAILEKYLAWIWIFYISTYHRTLPFEAALPLSIKKSSLYRRQYKVSASAASALNTVTSISLADTRNPLRPFQALHDTLYLSFGCGFIFRTSLAVSML